MGNMRLTTDAGVGPWEELSGPVFPQLTGQETVRPTLYQETAFQAWRCWAGCVGPFPLEGEVRRMCLERMGACKVELLLLAGASEGAWRPLGRSVENWERLSSSREQATVLRAEDREPMEARRCSVGRVWSKAGRSHVEWAGKGLW